MSAIAEESRIRFIKIARVILIIGIFIAVDLLLYRHFFQIHSYNGFVNGALTKAYPPDSGYLAMNSLKEGETIKAGKVIGEIYNEAPNLKQATLKSIAMPFKAPKSGVVYALHSHTGERVAPDRVVLDILDCNQAWVDTFVNEKDVAKIDTRQPVEIRILGNEDLPAINGQVQFIRYGAEQTMTESIQNLAEWQEKQEKDKELVMKLRPYNVESPKLALIRLSLKDKLPGNHNNFCYVGSKVEAVFKRR